MKIIVIKPVNNLRIKYDVKNVKIGYALNFLLPNKYAVIYSEKNMKLIDDLKKKELEIFEKNKSIIVDLLKTLVDSKHVFYIKYNEEVKKSTSSVSIKNVSEYFLDIFKKNKEYDDKLHFSIKSKEDKFSEIGEKIINIHFSHFNVDQKIKILIEQEK